MTGAEHEDFCFECHLGGELIECDACPKVYHKCCVHPKEVSNADVFTCQWHVCNICKANNFKFTDQVSVLCIGCPTSYCAGCVPADVAKRVKMIEEGDIGNSMVQKMLDEHNNSPAGQWASGMLPPNSKVFVCDGCEARRIFDSDEYVEKSIYHGIEDSRMLDGSLCCGESKGDDWTIANEVKDISIQSSNGANGTRSRSESAPANSVGKVALDAGLFNRKIEAFNFEGDDFIVLRRWSSSFEACKELEFDPKIILEASTSYEDYRKHNSESVQCGLSLMWCFNELQAKQADFSGTLFYPSVEVKEPSNQSVVLFTFSSIQEAVRLLTVDQMDIYKSAEAFNEYLAGSREDMPSLYGIHFRFTTDNTNEQTLKKKRMRDIISLNRIKELAKERRYVNKVGGDSQVSSMETTISSSSMASDADGVASNRHNSNSNDNGIGNSDYDGDQRKLRIDTSGHNSPRRMRESSAKERRFLTSPIGDSEGNRVDASGLFDERKRPMVGSNLYQVSDIPPYSPPRDGVDVDMAIVDGSDLAWNPSMTLSAEALLELRLCQYRPGLVVKVAHAQSLHSRGLRAEGGGANSSCTAVGMVVETPTPQDASIWLALSNNRVECFSEHHVQAIIQEDTLLATFHSTNGDLEKSKEILSALAEKCIEQQWTPLQMEFFFKCTAKHQDKISQVHSAVTGGEAGANSRVQQLSSINYHDIEGNGSKAYNTRHFTPFWTTMKHLISMFYLYHPVIDSDDFDERSLCTSEIYDKQQQNIVTVFTLASILKHSRSSEERSSRLQSLRDKKTATSHAVSSNALSIITEEFQEASPEEKDAEFDLAPLPLPKLPSNYHYDTLFHNSNRSVAMNDYEAIITHSISTPSNGITVTAKVATSNGRKRSSETRSDHSTSSETGSGALKRSRATMG